MKTILENKIFQAAIIASMLVGLFLLIVSPSFSMVRQLSTFTVHFMLSYLAAGLIFFALNQKNLMLVSMFCCGVLCLFLKGSSNQNMRLAQETSLPKLSIALVNVSFSDDGYQKTISRLKEVNPDIFVFQELTPDWSGILQDSLADSFPYFHNMVRLDPFGMAIYSKYPIDQVDTFYHVKIPNLLASILWDRQFPLQIVSALSLPPVNASAYENVKKHFRTIAAQIDTIFGPLIIAGDYNLPPWVDEVEQFKYSSKLFDSRRDISTRSFDGSVSFFGIPIDHIFFNDRLTCIAFNEISNENNSHLGILGTYQIKSKVPLNETIIQ